MGIHTNDVPHAIVEIKRNAIRRNLIFNPFVNEFSVIKYLQMIYNCNIPTIKMSRYIYSFFFFKYS